jgi:hypothetical protein
VTFTKADGEAATNRVIDAAAAVVRASVAGDPTALELAKAEQEIALKASRAIWKAVSLSELARELVAKTHQMRQRAELITREAAEATAAAEELVKK